MFYYAIPSGSPLARLFDKMLYEGQKREYMEEAMRVAEVPHAFFVVPSYWDRADSIVRGAKATADAWTEITRGRTTLWIFTYDRTLFSS